MFSIKQITISKQMDRQGVAHKLSLHTLQRQVLLLNLEEYVLLLTFCLSGVWGRVLLQGLPSVEPITFFAVLAGSLFGWKKGAMVGAASWYASNFLVFGGQGPWSVIHIASGLVAGLLGGLLFKKASYLKAVGVMAAATLFFEISMNIASGFFLGFGVLVSFLSAAPFMAVHLLTNMGFASLIPKTRKLVLEKGRLNERELCKEYINKLKIQKKV